MKKNFSLSLCILALANTNSQSYFPIPSDSSSQWRIQTAIWESNPWWMLVDDLMYFYDGDTVIGSNTYEKLYASGSRTVTSTPEPIINYYTHEYKGCTRNLGKKVYFHILNQDTLLYDFTVQAGDHLPLTYINNDTGVIVTSIDSVQAGSQYRKRYNLEGPPNGSLLSHWIIEGLGHELGLIEIMYGMPDYSSTFECYAENSTPIYPPGVECDLTIGAEEKSSIQLSIIVIPNPVTDLVTFRLGGKLPNYETLIILYDIFGKQVMKAVLPKGQTEITLDIRTLPPGLYCYGITQNLNRQTGKLVIVK